MFKRSIGITLAVALSSVLAAPVEVHAACSDEWQKLAKALNQMRRLKRENTGRVTARARSIRDNYVGKNQLVAGPKVRSEVEQFQKNPMLDGSVKIPSGLNLEFNLGMGGRNYEIRFKTKSIREQSKLMRGLMRDLKARSLHGPHETQREYNAYIFEFEDGETRVAKYTSNQLEETYSEDALQAFHANVNAKEGKKLRRIFHIHTHPDAEYDYLGPTTEDYNMVVGLQNSVSDSVGHDVPVEAIVLPNCANCEDLIFHYDKNGMTELAQK